MDGELQTADLNSRFAISTGSGSRSSYLLESSLESEHYECEMPDFSNSEPNELQDSSPETHSETEEVY